ncbi:isochorismate synthase [Streptosporangium canum]|uniref:isochorismate synthase n=1 Tax=Streptosporangium canum TaxID=324952 RepID=UPI0036A76475
MTLTIAEPLTPPAPPTPASAPSALAAYQVADSLLFTSEASTLLAHGRRRLITGSLAELPQQVTTALSGEAGAEAIAAGAISFDATTAHLIVPETVTWSGPLTPVAAPAPLGAWRIQREPAETYLTGVQRALQAIAAGTLDKVVLARALDVHTDRPLNLPHLLRRLAGRGRHVFAAPLPGGGTFLGASPELLISRHGRQIASTPLAGSAARSADPRTDRQRAEQLLHSTKDRHEHRLVVQAITDALQPYCALLHVPVEPVLISTPTMWHLATPITGRLRGDVDSLTLAAAVHPTPAICGTPTTAARHAIAELEPAERGFYGGLVGWSDARGDGEWALAIRCAEAHDRRLRLWAGAGIVTGSKPHRELAETSAKLRTLLDALAIPADA